MQLGRIFTVLGLVATMVALAIGMTGMTEAQGKLDIHAKGPDGLPIIFWTIKQHDVAKVEALLKAGANIEAKGYNSGTPILAAAIVNYWPMVLLLMERGADIGVADTVGFNLPYLTSKATPVKGSETEVALNAVRMALNERGMLEKVYTPAQIRDLMKAGKWPPK